MKQTLIAWNVLFFMHFLLILMLTKISKELSTCYKEVVKTKKFPNLVREKGRINYYSEKFYKQFGDKIIRKYLKDNPYKNWGINFELNIKRSKSS